MDIIQISIILSFAISIIIGLFVGKKVKNSSLNFTVAGRSLSASFVGLALVAQAIDGNATLGNTSLSHDFGFWAGASLIIGLAISLFLFGKFFAGPLNKLKLITMADLFETKFNRTIGFIASIILLLGFGILLAGNIATVGILLKLFFHIKYESAVILSSLVVLIYIFRGGILSDIYADFFQLFIVFAGIALTFLFLVTNFGMIDFSTTEIAGKFSLTQFSSIADGSLINWATIIALGFGNLIAIDFGSRIFSAKSPQEAKKGSYLGGILTLVLGIPFSLLIFYIFKLNVQPNSDIPIIVTFSQKILPPVISALLITGVINAALSTIDGAILSMGNILVRNILYIRTKKEHEDEATKKTELYFFRISLIPVTCAAIIFAFLLPSPGVLLSVAFDITFASLLIPFVFAFSDKLRNSSAALYAIIIGGVSRMIFATLTPTLFGAPNPFYIQNSLVSPSLDGLGTILAPLLALVTYMLVLQNQKKKGWLFFNT